MDNKWEMFEKNSILTIFFYVKKQVFVSTDFFQTSVIYFPFRTEKSDEK